MRCSLLPTSSNLTVLTGSYGVVKPPVLTHRLPESVRLERLAICTVCENNQRGMCLKCDHCSGKMVDYKVQAVFEYCSLKPPKWKAWIEPMSVEIKVGP